MPDTTRRLAAILFADIAGYTAMMQHGEQDALDKLARFKQTLEVKTAEFQGNIIQYYGAILRDKSCTLDVGLDCYILIDPLFKKSRISANRSEKTG